MEIEDLQKQLADMSGNVTKLVEGLGSLVPAVQDLQAQVKDIQAERATQQQAIQAAQTQEQQKAEREALLSDIKEIVAAASVEAANQAVPMAISKVLNPSGQPARKTVSLVQASGAGGGGDDDSVQVSPEDLRILQATKRLSYLRANNIDSIERMQLVDTLRQAGVATN